jgi:hypothetical protein
MQRTVITIRITSRTNKTNRINSRITSRTAPKIPTTATKPRRKLYLDDAGTGAQACVSVFVLKKVD